MTTEQPDPTMVKRRCRVKDSQSRECGRTYLAPVGSVRQGCPQCCTTLTDATCVYCGSPVAATYAVCGDCDDLADIEREARGDGHSA